MKCLQGAQFCQRTGFGDRFWIAGVVDASSGDEAGIGSLKERRGGPKVGLYVGRSMTQLRPGSQESKMGGALVLGAQNWVCGEVCELQ